jgi:hypothetical protein
VPAFFAGTKPQVQTPVSPKKKKNQTKTPKLMEKRDQKNKKSEFFICFLKKVDFTHWFRPEKYRLKDYFWRACIHATSDLFLC